MSSPAQTPEDVDFSKIVFLIADEKPFYRDMAHTALTRAGARDVKHATDIETAIQLMRRFGQRIGCVICEWDMAPVSGLALLQKIRTKALPKTPARTAVVFLTSRADSGAVKAAMALDVNGFAVAPLSSEKLVKTIASGLARAWTLKPPADYAAVPLVDSSQAPPPKAHVRPKDTVKRAEPDDPAAPASKPKRHAAKIVNVRMCVLKAVKPGDIVARDIKDRDGHLMLSTGTELRPNLIERLKDLAEGNVDSYHVWVGAWEPESFSA